jgi:opacity protein-like surface antigen
MKRLTILAAGLSAVIAAPAMAGGMAEPAPAPVVMAPVPVVSGTDWTGPSVGVQLGYGDVSTTGPDLSGNDWLYGLRAYYDYDFGDFILGGGLQYDGTGIDLGGSGLADGTVTVDSVLRIGARAGADLGTSWIYGTAGWAQVSTSDVLGGIVGDSDGWFAGVGYEIFVASNITLGAEILYHEFSNFDLLENLEADATTAAVSVNFRF